MSGVFMNVSGIFGPVLLGDAHHCRRETDKSMVCVQGYIGQQDWQTDMGRSLVESTLLFLDEHQGVRGRGPGQAEGLLKKTCLRFSATIFRNRKVQREESWKES